MRFVEFSEFSERCEEGRSRWSEELRRGDAGEDSSEEEHQGEEGDITATKLVDEVSSAEGEARHDWKPTGRMATATTTSALQSEDYSSSTICPSTPPRKASSSHASVDTPSVVESLRLRACGSGTIGASSVSSPISSIFDDHFDRVEAHSDGGGCGGGVDIGGRHDEDDQEMLEESYVEPLRKLSLSTDKSATADKEAMGEDVDDRRGAPAGFDDWSWQRRRRRRRELRQHHRSEERRSASKSSAASSLLSALEVVSGDDDADDYSDDDYSDDDYDDGLGSTCSSSLDSLPECFRPAAPLTPHWQQQLSPSTPYSSSTSPDDDDEDHHVGALTPDNYDVVDERHRGPVAATRTVVDGTTDLWADSATATATTPTTPVSPNSASGNNGEQGEQKPTKVDTDSSSLPPSWLSLGFV
jgi:hypothetical protein